MTEALPSAPTRAQVITALTRSLLLLADRSKESVVPSVVTDDLKTLLKDFVSAESAGDPRAAAACLVAILEETLGFTSELSFDFGPWILAVIQDFPQEVLIASLPVLEAHFGVALGDDAAHDAYYQQVRFEAERSGIVCQGLMGPTGTVQPSRGGHTRVVKILRSGFNARLGQFSD